LRIVAFGDSITGHRPREAYLDKYLKWSDLLELMVEVHRGPGKAQVLNRGWAGDATYEKKTQSMPGAVARLKTDVIDERPAIAIVLISGNDKKDTSADRDITRTNLTRIAGDLKTAEIKALFVQYAVLPNPKNPEKAWMHLVKNNDLIAEVAKAHDFPTVALQPAFDDALKSQPITALVNASDGVHLAPGGEMVVARTLFARLKELGWLTTSEKP
jgi:lysophospholipase L1-like esterase